MKRLLLALYFFHPNLKWEHEYFFFMVYILGYLFNYLSLLRFVKNSDITGCLKILKIIWFWFCFSKLVVTFLSMKYGEPDKQRETLAEAWKDRWVWWNPGLELHTTQFWNLEVRISVSDVIGGDKEYYFAMCIWNRTLKKSTKKNWYWQKD